MTSLSLDNDKLKNISTPINFGVDLSCYINQMKDILISKGGVSLSAPQVGINERLFIVNDSFLTNNIKVIINPEIDYKSNLMEELEEGCVSFPDKFITIKRPELIHVKYYDENWNLKNCYLSGIKARIFLQNVEFLDGKCRFFEN